MTAPLIRNPANAANYLSPAYRRLARGWLFVRLIRAINDSIRDQSAAILPRADAEGVDSYRTRVAMTFGYNALDEALHGLVGVATRHDPVLEADVPPRLVKEWEDIDGQGTHGAVFVQRALNDALQDGHAALLVDYPLAPAGLTLAQEQALGLRAYVLLKTIDQITSWSIGRVLGRHVVTMVKLAESREIPDGKYGSKTIPRFRTLRQAVRPDGVTPYVTYEVEEATEATSAAEPTYVTVASGEIRGPGWMAFFPFYGGEQVGLLDSRPPLQGMAYSNLDHTQVKSDRRYSMHKCAITIPVFRGRTRTAGIQQEKLVVSSDDGIDVSEAGGAEYLEPKGTALQALLDELNAIERRMGSQGYSMLRSQSPQTMTATEKVLQQSREDSKLSRAVRSLHDALESAFDAMAQFYGLPDGGSIMMPQEFTDTFLEPAEMTFLADLEEAGKLTLSTLLHELQKGGRVLQGVDLEAELAAIELQEAEEPALAMPGMVVLPPEPVPGTTLPVGAVAMPPAA